MRKIIFLFPSRMGTYNTEEMFTNSSQSGKAAGEIGQMPLNNTKRKPILFISL